MLCLEIPESPEVPGDQPERHSAAPDQRRARGGEAEAHLWAPPQPDQRRRLRPGGQRS